MPISAGKSFPTVAIVGAGMAGLACAAQLRAAGVSVSVFDKGRRPGGRMSTRGVDDKLSFDHGCQFFSANDPSFDQQVKSWIEAGVVSAWRGTVVELGRGRITQKATARTRYAGLPEMSAVCSHLATGIDVRSGVDVNEVRRIDNKWHLLRDTGASLGQFDALIVATPPAQAEKLMTHSPSLLVAARGVRMSSCWTVMLAFEERVGSSFDGAVVHNSPLSWIARNSSRAGRIDTTDCWVGQSSAEWSTERRGASRDAIVAELADEFCKLVGISAKPDYLAGHRWKYAIPTTPLDKDCLFDDMLNVGLCGDWCLGNRVEAAWLSGTAAAKRLQAQGAGI
jgi:predicted NAD/FAD-dependent oxidoreductase